MQYDQAWHYQTEIRSLCVVEGLLRLSSGGVDMQRALLATSLLGQRLQRFRLLVCTLRLRAMSHMGPKFICSLQWDEDSNRCFKFEGQVA